MLLSLTLLLMLSYPAALGDQVYKLEDGKHHGGEHRNGGL